MAELAVTLTDSIQQLLRKEKLVLLGTLDADKSTPQSNAISWVYAMNESSVRFAVDQRSRIIANIKANPHVNMTFIGDGTVHTLNGQAKVVADQLEGVSIRLACIEIQVDSVRDAMFFGARIIVEPEYEKTYDKRAADKLDNQVYEAMKKV